MIGPVRKCLLDTRLTSWCFEASSEVTTAVIAAALFVARAMAAERPYPAVFDVELGSSAEPRRPWKISRDEFWANFKTIFCVSKTFQFVALKMNPRVMQVMKTV